MTEPPVGPPGVRVTPRFAGPDTFARLPRLGDVGYELLGMAARPDAQAGQA